MENQKNIFTAERIAALKTCVENGGTLLLTLGAPEALSELLPVEIGEAAEPGLDVYAQNFERCPDEITMINHIAALLPGINTALDFGMPFIRTTDCGTMWINDKSGAIFVWDNVKELQISLPDGFAITKMQLPDQKMRDFQEDDLKNVPSETIFIIGRK